jgi:hypothetical protein
VRAHVREKREVAKGTLLVVFDLLGREVDFTPGQYFWVTLLDPSYEDEKGPPRHISVVTSPTSAACSVFARVCATARSSALSRSCRSGPRWKSPREASCFPRRPIADTCSSRAHRPRDQGGEGLQLVVGITVFHCMLRYIAEEQLAHRPAMVDGVVETLQTPKSNFGPLASAGY